MRVVVVHPYSFPEVRRGGERYLHDLVRYLHEADHDVTMITGTDGPGSQEVEDGVEVLRLQHRIPRRLARRGMTRDETFGVLAFPHLLRRRADAVFALTPTAALAARAAGQRTVYSILGHPTPGQLAGRPWLRRTFVAAVRASHTTAALSESSAEGSRATFGRRAVVLSPGVRLSDFPCRDDVPDPARPWRILFPAHAEDRRKGLDVLLRAFEILSFRRSDARLVLGGPGDPSWALAGLPATTRERIESRIDRLDAGTLQELPARYRAATMTVLPSRDEAFGLVLVESLSSGTPVVCTSSGGPAEIVDDPGIGRVVAPDDPTALADALEEVGGLVTDPDLPARCAAHARRWGWLERIGREHEDVLTAAARR